MKYKCPWCGSTNTGRHAYSYANHFLKGTFCYGGSLALGFLTMGKSNMAQMASNGAGNGLQNLMKYGCYDYQCKTCKKDFYVYYDEREGEKIEILKTEKQN